MADCDAAGILVLERQPGRLRQQRHALLAVPVVLAGWTWLGAAGALPLLLWWWRTRPRTRGRGLWRIDLGRVRRARLGAWRVRLEGAGTAPLEIFCDELRPADLAQLRRCLKRQLAAG